VTNRRRLVSLTLVVLAAGCGKPAQIGPDPEAYKAVDALFTAVGSRRVDLLDQCDRNLQQLKEQGKVPAAAYRSLAAVIATARKERWQRAADDLRWFMRGQEAVPRRSRSTAKKGQPGP
jgi:hypothetical protein